MPFVSFKMLQAEKKGDIQVNKGEVVLLLLFKAPTGMAGRPRLHSKLNVKMKKGRNVLNENQNRM